MLYQSPQQINPITKSQNVIQMFINKENEYVVKMEKKVKCNNMKINIVSGYDDIILMSMLP